MTPILCNGCGGRCGVRWQAFVNGTKHIRAYCPQCSQFAGYVPQTPETVAQADAGLFDDVREP